MGFTASWAKILQGVYQTMKKFLAVTLTCALLLAGLLACAGQTEEKQRSEEHTSELQSQR